MIGEHDAGDEPPRQLPGSPRVPVRGPLSLTASVSNPQIVAGTDFSIFVIVQNPFDVPVTLYELQTHLPVELLDVNRAMLRAALTEQDGHGSATTAHGMAAWLRARQHLLDSQTGFATAVGTAFSPKDTAEFIKTSITVGDITGGTVTGVMFNFPENPTSDELDQIMRRWVDYRSGVVPVSLQPGDQIVRQFRLRTQRWVFFTPLSHTFQIQAYFSVDGTDHNCTIAYAATIRARLGAITLGGAVGAILGGVLKLLTDTGANSDAAGALQALTVATLATLAVVVGFARKSGSQSFVSVEDFWGGALIGFSVGFVGYSQFLNLFGEQ